MVIDNFDIYCSDILPKIRAILPEADKILGTFDCRFEA